jgi:acylphosphatase
MRARAHIFISGTVQGVFFRSRIMREARKHGVNGWVRNTLDGRVEAVLEGEEENVKEIIEFCKRGPPGARVADVDVVWERYSGDFKDFEIRYGY